MTLHEALASVGLSSRPSDTAGKRRLTDLSGLEIGDFDASEGWLEYERRKKEPAEPQEEKK